jgi:hypothetical protein
MTRPSGWLGTTTLKGPKLEIIVYVVDSVQGRRFREHAVASRSRFARYINNSLILVVSVADRHAEIATAPKYSGIFTQNASDFDIVLDF